MTHLLNIIVPVYRNAGLVELCLNSLLQHLPEIAEHSPRIVVVNDCPGDRETDSLLRAFANRPEIELINNERNLGFVRSCNIGMALALRTGRNVLLVNSDTLSFPGTLKNILTISSADPQIGFVSPRSNNASICSLPHFVDQRKATATLAHEQWLELSRTMPAFHFTPTAVGFYLFIAYAVLANHGFFSEEFGQGYEEENDLIMRAGKVGVRAVLANHSFAFHSGSASFDLSGFDVTGSRQFNLATLRERHPEFMPRISRYENSPHRRAEEMMTGLLADSAGRIKVALDMTSLGLHHDGTGEQSVAVVRALAGRYRSSIRLTVIVRKEAFAFHGLDKLEGVTRVDAQAAGLHAICIRLNQPFTVEHVSLVESCAPINVYAMLDTIAEDCGPLSTAEIGEIWDHVAKNANGLVFISKFSQQTFYNRHPEASKLPRLSRLLPTCLAEYRYAFTGESSRSHVLILGNQFAHKGCDSAALAISKAHPDLKIIVFGSSTWTDGNIISFRAGSMSHEQVAGMLWDARIVVLPSYVEGFGLGLMHALSAGRPVVARRIAATEEILASFESTDGVFLFDQDPALLETFARALVERTSRVIEGSKSSWSTWSDELIGFGLALAERDDVFTRLVDRVAAFSQLREARQFRALVDNSSLASAIKPRTSGHPRALELNALLALEGQEFVEHAYATLLCRPADAIGLAEYSRHLEEGMEKADLLHALALSAEGRIRDVNLVGLAELRAKKSKWPRIVRRIYRASANWLAHSRT
jgi:GT2 family glycosyltransferase/glycosyltransferase involved in cell wall biosynthesis